MDGPDLGMAGEDADLVHFHVGCFFRQCNPFAGAVIGEFRDMERAFIEQRRSIAAWIAGRAGAGDDGEALRFVPSW